MRPREIRPYLYAGFDFLLALVYAGAIIQAPTRHGLGGALLWGAAGAVLLAGAGMLWRRPWGRRIAMAGCAALLVLCVLILVLILMSAAFLSGVYGSMGEGAAMIALLAGAVVIQFLGILPALQLKFLMTRAGRRTYGAPA
jgi:hypothetical protein